MATAREESNPYDGGLGAGGKFKKRPFRRTTQSTPYDRPATSIRNPSGSVVRNGWLSKLVDPAQRLIASSAHKLFASVFRKRLQPPPPHPSQAPESETNQDARENPPGGPSTVLPVVQGDVMGCENPSSHADEGGVAELEEILKQKTFTRSEIDRLTSLLHSRAVEISGGNEEKISEVKPVVYHDKKKEFLKTPVQKNGTEDHLISTPVVSSTVLDEDVASPAELAKAYMGSRPSKASASMLRLQNQVPSGDSALLSDKIFPSRSPTSLVPRSSAHVCSTGNGFVTPRSWGRSAIYNMARTPYSRVNSAAVLKNAGTSNDAFVGPSSSSQSAWEQNRISGSRHGVLKRRSSVLDNDIGSVGPIRRIRQKSNLLSSKSLSLPASAGPQSAHSAGTSSAGLDTLAENGHDSMPGTSFKPVPSKSSEMASKILQQLDKLVSPGDKSPAKLSPSMLRGQALKSLENVDSSNFLENMYDNDKLIASHSTLPDIQDSQSHKCDEVKENGSTALVSLPGKSVPAVNGVDPSSLMNYSIVPTVKAAASAVIKSDVQPLQKRRAFHMSAHEDYLDLDEDDYPNGPVSTTIGEGIKMLDDCVMGSKSAAPEVVVDMASSLSEAKPICSVAFNQNPDSKTSDGSAVVEKNAGVTFPVVPVANSSVHSEMLVFQSPSTVGKDDVNKESNVPSPMPGIGEEVAAAKQSDATLPTFCFASTDFDEVSTVSGSSSGVMITTNADQKLEKSTSIATTTGTTNNLSDKTDKENTLNGTTIRTPETAAPSAVSTSVSSGSIFKFGALENSTSKNGSLASSPFPFSSPVPSVLPNNGQSSSSSSTSYFSFTTNSNTSAAASASATANATISSTEASVPTFTTGPVFKFASSGDPSTSVSTLTSSGDAPEPETKDASLGNVGIAPFGCTSAFTTSVSVFGGTSELTGSTSSASGCKTAAITSSGNSTSSGVSSTVANPGSGFFSSTFSTGTSKGNAVFGGSSATTGTGSIFGGSSLPIDSTGSNTFATASGTSSTGSNIFGFGASAASASASASASTSPTQGSSPFTQASVAGTGIGTTQSMPIQFSSSASTPSFGVAGNSSFSSGSSMFGSSASTAMPFGSGAAMFGMSSSASETNSLSSSSGIASASFGSWQAPKTTIFGSSSGFSFGSSASVSASSSTAPIFGSSTGASSSSMFSFTSAAAAAPSQPVFGSTSSGMVFGSTPSNNNDQMEDSMAEDTVQASPSPTVPLFGQQPISPPASGFIFGASNPSGASSFQFGGQPSIATSQNPSPFQASGSLEFGAGGSFSLGTGGSDKSARKFVKVRKQRKK